MLPIFQLNYSYQKILSLRCIAQVAARFTTIIIFFIASIFLDTKVIFLIFLVLQFRFCYSIYFHFFSGLLSEREIEKMLYWAGNWGGKILSMIFSAVLWYKVIKVRTWSEMRSRKWKFQLDLKWFSLFLSLSTFLLILMLGEDFIIGIKNRNFRVWFYFKLFFYSKREQWL